ncbi:MAG: IS701 family transposase, partial [Cyclobacteriaceae bacterium]
MSECQATKRFDNNSKLNLQNTDNQLVNKKRSHEELGPSLKASLSEFLSEFKSVFKCGKRDNSHTANQLVKGLFCTARGERNLERIVEQTCDDINEAYYQKMQHFVTNSPWDSKALMSKIGLYASDLFKDWQNTAYIIDEKAHLKKGTQSVGVDNQYAGVVGKTENCQVAVYSALVNGKYATPINTRLFLPKSWCDDVDRCKKAHIPTDQTEYKSKQELALQMLKEDLKNGLKFGWVGADGFYGHGYEFSDQVEALGQNFVFDVHATQNIYLTKPTIGLPKAKKTGRPLKRKKVLCGTKPIEAREYLKQLEDKDFQKVVIRKTPKGKLVYKIHVVKVWTWIAPSYREKGQPEPRERTLIIRRGLSKRSKTKYTLSNIAIDQASTERFAFMQAQRFWIEKSFRDNSKDIGMSDYQIRKHRAWYHYQAITMLAMLFVLKEQIKNKEELPLISHRDIKVLIQSFLSEHSIQKVEVVIKQMINRHRK